MNAIKYLLMVLLVNSVVGYYSRYQEVQTNEISRIEDEEGEAEDVAIEDFSHRLGLESLLHSHKDEPANLFHALLDDDFDQYENITAPKQKGDSVVKVRKAKLAISPSLRKVLIDYLREQNNPDLDQLIIDFRLDED